MMKQVNRYHPFRTLLLTALLGAALVSCSKQESEPLPPSGDGVIRMSAEIASAPQGKGISLTNGAQTGLAFLRKDDAGATAPSSFADAARFTADRAANGTLSNFSPRQLYNLNDNYAYFVGYHPAGTPSSGTTTWTLANGGKTDLILTETVWGAGRFSAPLTSGMTFEHQLACLQVVCTLDPTVALSLVRSAWGQVTKIEILGTATTATFSHSTRQMSFSGSTALNLSAADCQTDFTNITLTANNTPCAGGIFAPVGATTPIKLRVYTTTTTGGQTVDVQLKSGSANKGFAKGMTHTATLTFGVDAKNIEVTTTSVEAWAVGGTGGADDITSVPIMTPSQGVLDMRYSELIKSGSMAGTPANITSTTASYNGYTYNSSNANNNGGYITSERSALAEHAYYKLEVAKADETVPAGTSGWSSNGTQANWTTAWAACKAKAPAGEWRLPRASELALMYLNKTKLADTPGFTAFAVAYYWSSVQNSNGISWYVDLFGGATFSYAKTITSSVRCVKEL